MAIKKMVKKPMAKKPMMKKGGVKKMQPGGPVTSMTSSTDPKNEVRLVPKKEYYGMGERELKESARESRRLAESNPDPLMKDRHYTNEASARATLAENRDKMNVGKLPVKKANELYIKPDRSILNNPPGPMNKSKKNSAKKPKMMSGGTKPKAMYGTSMKPGMMKKGGAKKK